MRKILIAVVLLAVITVLVAVGGILYVRNVKPDYDESVAAAGVHASIEVWRDTAGVPHVWAQNDEDLYFAQGYTHAQERLWQLELFRRVAEGRLAEVFGASMIDTDKFLRTIGIWRAAGANEGVLDAAARRLLDAYVAGVNEWIDHHNGPLPPEFLALRIQPEHWTVRNSLAIEKIMAWDLSLYDGAASLSKSTHTLGAAKAKYLGPTDPPWGATIIENPQISQIPPIPNAAHELLDALSITRASNAWVIGGTRTTSGKPILANDMHLALRQPGVWYLMALHAPGTDVAGMTLPGVPNVIAGHNRAVAWGFTNAMLDDVDFFIERADPKDATRYLTPHGSQPFTTASQSVRVKGRAEPVNFVVRMTRHGPVISDVEKRLRGTAVIAMQWAAAEASHSLMAFPLFNRARNAQELRAAIPFFDNPHQNIVYADTAGHFGYQMAGRIPIRGARMRPPILPVPGWTGKWDWEGFLPFADQPASLDPAAGFVVTANNRQVRSAIGDLISNDWEAPYRAMRIREMILEAPKHDAATVHRMQLDVKDLLAVRYKLLAVRAAQAASLNDVARQLASWNGVAERDSRPAAYFYVWYEMLRRHVMRTLFGMQAGAFSRDALSSVLDAGSIGWLGAAGTTVLDSLARAAMLEADSVALGKTWGDLHQVVIAHALGEIAAVEKVLSLNVGPAPHRGSTTTVDVAQYGSKQIPFRTSYGPSERHVVDMADVDGQGGFILPTGQSGLPASEHYADMFERWRNGGLWRIPLDRRAARARTVHRMVIRPISAPEDR